MTQSPDEALGALSRSAATQRGLRLLLLFGSRARADARARSDWDLGYLAGPELDPSALLLDVVTALRTDRVDLVDLARAGAQVRFRAAAEGRVVHAADEGTFQRFWTDAVTFWCDAEPVIRKGYADVLARLAP